MIEKRQRGKDLTRICWEMVCKIKASVIIYNTELILAKKE